MVDVVDLVVGSHMIEELPLFAHSANSVHGPGERHLLSDHLRSTARLAASFAEPFGAGRLAFALGLFHDAGKAECSWQGRLVMAERSGGRVGGAHWELGTKLLLDAANVGAMAVFGHHGGLGTVDDLEAVQAKTLDDEDRTLKRFLDAVPEARTLMDGDLFPRAWDAARPSVRDIGVRLVFSALVDADHLDTAAHFAGKPPPELPVRINWDELVCRFEAERSRRLSERRREQGRSWIDDERSALYDQVVAQAALPPGIYRLPAPTGSGKTITAAGFALHHAAAHQRARVIVAVPFLTITEQNAAVYRGLLGDDSIVEHHSQVEFDGRDHRDRLAAENWDAPFVVTTTVQLFDSLFGNRPARSRKLHRLANAVIVLDEVQALPLTLLTPILDALRVLAENFGTTVLLTSATQPSFEAVGAWAGFTVVPLVPDGPARALFSRLARVRYEWLLEPRPTSAEVARQVSSVPEGQALVVVNTIDHARRMFDLLTDDADVPVRHLSTRMCPEHRRAVLAEVTELLAAGEPILVVSTQLIEAGVDVDFPVVFRALAPAESLQQAAGRANREGVRPGLGRVVIFDAVDMPVPRFYVTAVGSTRLQFGPEPDRTDPDNLESLDAYYRHLYTTVDVDHGERGRRIQQSRSDLDFPSVALGPLRDGSLSVRESRWAFRMIDDDTVSVVVTPSQSVDRVDMLLADIADPALRRADTFRALRPFLVTLPNRAVTDPAWQSMLTPVTGQLYRWEGKYHDHLGLVEGLSGVEMVL